jgi:outer membrane protein TolC
LLGPGAAGIELAIAAPLSYGDARVVLQSVSDLHKSGEAGVGRSDYEARAADSLGLPEVFVNATEVFGVKQTKITGTPLGEIDINQNLNGPRASVNGTWLIYSGGRITATQRALAAGVDQARAELNVTEEQLDLQLAQVYFGLELASNIERTRTSGAATGRPATGARRSVRAAGDHGQGGTTERPGLARRGGAGTGACAA